MGKETKTKSNEELSLEVIKEIMDNHKRKYNITGNNKHPIALFFPTPVKLGISPTQVDTNNTNSPRNPEKTNTNIITTPTTPKQRAL